MKIIEETNWLLRNNCCTPLTLLHFERVGVFGAYFALLEENIIPNYLTVTLISIYREDFYKYEFIRNQSSNLPIVKKINI